MGRLVVLLRGINVGKAKQVPMGDLRELLEGAGYSGAVTHLRSGNAIVTSRKQPDTAAREIEKLLQKRFGFDVDVVVRTAAEIAAAAAADPFAGVADDPAKEVVAFLGGTPDAGALAALVELDVAPERLAVGERALHLWCPGGLNDSPLSKALARAKLGIPVTARNRRTVEKLAELAAE